MLKKALVDDRQAAGQIPVELRLDPAAARIIPGTPATDRDFDTEFLDYILAVAVVDSVDAAIAHILQHSKPARNRGCHSIFADAATGRSIRPPRNGLSTSSRTGPQQRV